MSGMHGFNISLFTHRKIFMTNFRPNRDRGGVWPVPHHSAGRYVFTTKVKTKTNGFQLKLFFKAASCAETSPLLSPTISLSFLLSLSLSKSIRLPGLHDTLVL